VKVKELRPIKDKPDYYARVEREIAQHLKKTIYEKLMRAARAPIRELKNSYDDLIDAIAQGDIQYVGGHFEGKFNSKISKALKDAGATWDAKQGWWKLPRSKLTSDMKTAIGTSYSRFKETAERVDTALKEIVPEDVAAGLSISKAVDKTIWSLNKDFVDSTAHIRVAPKFTPTQARQLSTQYNENMRLYIKDWTHNEIRKLRADVAQSVVKGYRYETLIKGIQDSYGVSINKARFLARQETNLLVSAMRQQRYTDAGFPRYKWKCVAGSPKHPVRKMHKALDNTIQTWSSPPVVDEHGNRKHPGQDYGCRCIAVPLVEAT